MSELTFGEQIATWDSHRRRWNAVERERFNEDNAGRAVRYLAEDDRPRTGVSAADRRQRLSTFPVGRGAVGRAGRAVRTATRSPMVPAAAGIGMISHRTGPGRQTNHAPELSAECRLCR